MERRQDRRKPNKYVLMAIAVGHLTVTALTWRDLQRRPDDLVRGDKRVWRVLSALNTANSAVYWLIGRRSRPPG